MADFAVLPEGVTDQDFSNALEEYAAVVGNENVFVSAENLNSYNKIMIPADNLIMLPQLPWHLLQPKRCRPLSISAINILFPSGQYLPVKTSVMAQQPVRPGGQVILDLRRMNRIIEVDAELGQRFWNQALPTAIKRLS